MSEVWSFNTGNSVINVATTPNCSLIAAATVGKSLHLLDIDGKELWQKGDGEELDHEAWSVAISDDGAMIAVGTANKNPADGSVYIYSSSGDLIWTDRFHTPIWSLTFNSTGNILFASTWSGKILKIEREQNEYKLTKEFNAETKEGMYGVACSDSFVFCCAYEQGIYKLDYDLNKVKTFDIQSGLYNIARASKSETIVAGSRNGKIYKIVDDEIQTITVSSISRPICGIDNTQSGELIICGSFDGKLYILNQTGKIISSHETDGELWSVSCSSDGRSIVSGSGDGTIRYIKNNCSISAIEEINSCELHLLNNIYEIEKSLDRLVTLYEEYGVYEYGFTLIKDAKEKFDHSVLFNQALERLLIAAIDQKNDNFWAHYQLGIIYQNKNHHASAIEHLQKASIHPEYTSKALSLCAESFNAKQLIAATSACYRRARLMHGISNQAKHVLYNLGRSYEDTKQWDAAISHYQLLVSWDFSYRNTWQRLERLLSIHGYSRDSKYKLEDYTGLTISLLGSDAPRDVDSELLQVLEARTAEILIKPKERKKVANIIEMLRKNEAYCKGITGTGLDYSQQLFLKYDYSLPEDETKKFLETVNLLYLIGNRKLNKTLDIGSATGRYPTLFTWLGAKARGIDIEINAIEYAKNNVPEGNEWPKFEIGDATNLPFREKEFDLVTCMMGTFSHIESSHHQNVITSIYNALEDGGCLAISTWDLECEHLAYLSIYNENQKEEIRKNTPSTEKLETIFLNAGFSKVIIRPFALLPQMMVYDLGTENLRAGDIQLIAQADLAVRSLHPNKHGEMYLAFGIKGSTD